MLSNSLYEYGRIYNIEFPSIDEGISQREEFFFATIDGQRKQISIHDYKTMYQYPLLYDVVLYLTLKCETPQEICRVLKESLQKKSFDPQNLKILEIGAGSGAFGESLKNQVGIKKLIGLDIEPLAEKATSRDRKDLYDAYFVLDLTKMTSSDKSALIQEDFNCIALASAAGFGNHIPVEGFEAAFNLLKKDDWFIYHVKRDQKDQESIDLCKWIDRKIDEGKIELVSKESCFHRKSINGQDIFYDVIIGTVS